LRRRIFILQLGELQKRVNNEDTGLALDALLDGCLRRFCPLDGSDLIGIQDGEIVSAHEPHRL